MNIKQIFLTLIVLFAINSVATSQVKKQYRDDVHKSTTVVIKENDANDLDILNSQFNLDDYKVNEQIKITTDQSLSSAPNTSENVSGGQSIPPTAPDLTSATATTSYERPKTKMRRWSVRQKKENTNTEALLEDATEKESAQEAPITVVEKPSRTKTVKKVKKSSGKKYQKKSKKVKKKRRNRKFKKRKVKRNKKLGCYIF